MIEFDAILQKRSIVGSNLHLVHLKMNGNLLGVKSIDVLVDRLKLYANKLQTLSSVFILLRS